MNPRSRVAPSRSWARPRTGARVSSRRRPWRAGRGIKTHGPEASTNVRSVYILFRVLPSGVGSANSCWPGICRRAFLAANCGRDLTACFHSSTVRHQSRYYTRASAYYRLFTGMAAKADFPAIPRWLGYGRCGRDPSPCLHRGGEQERAGEDPCRGVLVGSAAAAALMGGRPWSPRAWTVCQSPRLIRASTLHSRRKQGGPPISAPIIICGVSIVILGFGDAGCRGGAAVSRGLPASASHRRSRFTRALEAPDTCLVSGALSRGYPGHRTTRRPVPAGLERNEA
jgi:hypothetical protein